MEASLDASVVVFGYILIGLCTIVVVGCCAILAKVVTERSNNGISED